MELPSSALYEKVALNISRMIEKGTLRIGERIPSVRRMSAQNKVSISTVLQAYRVLENQGLVEARPQSGYYVCPKKGQPREPSVSKPSATPAFVGINSLVSAVLEIARSPTAVPLGTACPGPMLMPVSKLRRTLSSMALRYPESLVTYAFPPGNETLRRQISRRALDQGCSLDKDEIVVTNGCMEALNLCLRAVAKTGDTIALESPSYYGLLQIIESLGMKALEIPTHPREGMSIDAMELATRKRGVKACVITNVSNPLGSLMPEENKLKLVALLTERNIPLIEDDVFGDLHYGDIGPRRAKAFDKTGMVLLCSSFTKTLAPGFPIGWVAPGKFKPQVEMLKFINSVATTDILQLTLAEFLANGGYDHHLRSLRRTFARQVQLTTDAIAEFFPAGTKVTRPTGGFVLWVEFPARVNALLLQRQCAKENIGIAPGPMFTASKSRYRNCIRLSCGYPWSSKIERSLMRIGELADTIEHVGTGRN